MTDEQGANYSDIDCVLIGNGKLRCVYLKGRSEIMEVGCNENGFSAQTADSTQAKPVSTMRAQIVNFLMRSAKK